MCQRKGDSACFRCSTVALCLVMILILQSMSAMHYAVIPLLLECTCIYDLQCEVLHAEQRLCQTSASTQWAYLSYLFTES